MNENGEIQSGVYKEVLCIFFASHAMPNRLTHTASQFQTFYKENGL